MEGGSTSPKAMRTAEDARIKCRPLSLLLSTRPQVAFHRRAQKSARVRRGRFEFQRRKQPGATVSS
jgi:hypothetical protein